MINVLDLENRWFKFKIKSYIPHVIIGLSLIVIVAVTLFLLNSKDNDITSKVKIENKILIPLEEKELQNSTIVSVQTKVEENSTKKSIQPIVEKRSEIVQIQNEQKVQQIEPEISKKKMVLTPSLNFMKSMQQETLPYYENEENVKEKKVKNIKSNKKKVIIKPKAIEKVKIEPVQEKIQKSSISIKKRNTQEDIHHVIKRFKTNNNPALSLFIAKKYYELGEYHKSYNYALMTNEINNNIEASWIIFVKSLVKLNEKDMAIKTLNKYIDHSGSNKAKILLDEIISGKFK